MKNESVGARTRDLRIKSPLLYQLSYTPNCVNSERDYNVPLAFV